MERTLSTKKIILDICSMRSRAKKIISEKPEYAELIEAITDKDYYNDDSLSIPTAVGLAKKTKRSLNTVERLLENLYADLCSFEFASKIPFEVDTYSVRFSLLGASENVILLINGMKNIPKKGDDVKIPYFSEYTGTEIYYVDHVYHDFTDNRHEVFISLRNGRFNSYFDSRKAEAEETGVFSMRDTFMTPDSELRKKLGLEASKIW